VDAIRSCSSVMVDLFYRSGVLSVFVVRAGLERPYVASGPLPEGSLDQLVHDLPSILRSPHGPATSATWKHLSALIVEPLQTHLRRGDRVIFIPHRILHFLPLHLLLFEGRPIVESNAVAYSVSLTVLSRCQVKNRKRRDKAFRPTTLAVVGLDFEEEAGIVSAHFASPEVLLRSCNRITREAIASAVKRKDVVHFSGHCRITAGDPDNSGLVLSDDPASSVLSLRDVYALELDSYLVTVGACSSALGAYADGDELLGLPRGFLYAGAPSVLASLWPVADAPTMMLMDRFYLQLLGGGLDKADALRVAQQETRERYERAIDWAGFVLSGDWV
jgi:CHAT domain-containing protein